MVNVIIKTESHYTIDRARIRKTVSDFLTKRGVKGAVEVGINIVGDRFMKSLNQKYRQITETTSVLTFGLSQEDPGKPFIDPPDDVLRLGDIAISYPQARDRASEDEMLVDDKIDELVIHGLINLMGS